MLRVGVFPCDTQGRPLSEDTFSTPAALLESRIDFLIKISYARGLRWVSEDSTRGVVGKYRFYTDSKKRATKTVTGTINPEFDYAKQFTMRAVSQSFLDYLESNALVVELWGQQGTGRVFHPSTVKGDRAADDTVMEKVRDGGGWQRRGSSPRPYPGPGGHARPGRSWPRPTCWKSAST